MKIPIKKYVENLSLPPEERYKLLMAHHEEETKFLLKTVDRLLNAARNVLENYRLDGTLEERYLRLISPILGKLRDAVVEIDYPKVKEGEGV